MSKFARRSLNFLTCGITFVYALSCCSPFISPASFWPMTFLGLGFPVTTLTFILFIITWFFLKRTVAFVLFIVLLAGYSNLTSVVAFNISDDFKLQKDSANLRILSWNVNYLDNSARHADSPSAARRLMINYIKQINADVLLLQEFREYHNPNIFSNISTIRDTLGYRYCYFGGDDVEYPSWGKTESGCAIFSRYPIVSGGKVLFKDLVVPESLLFSDININGKKIRFYTVHLVSLNLAKAVLYREDKTTIDSTYIYHASTFDKLKHFDSLHAEQAGIIHKTISSSKYPVVFSGDLNSVPSSYVYHKTRGSLQDVFLRKGCGLGRTYYTKSPTLRIDYIFADRKIAIDQFTSPRLHLSDHFPLVADIRLK